MNHISIDIETYSLCQRAHLLSVGAVMLDSDFNIAKAPLFHYIVRWEGQEGRRVCNDTMMWWEGQSKEARAMSFGKPHGSKPLTTLKDWINTYADDPEEIMVWAGPDWFDLGVLKDYAEDPSNEENPVLPWTYKQTGCISTIEHLMALSGTKYTEVLPTVPHCPVSDSVAAAVNLKTMFDQIGWRPM